MFIIEEGVTAVAGGGVGVSVFIAAEVILDCIRRNEMYYSNAL